MWYVLARYVSVLLGRNHLQDVSSNDEEVKSSEVQQKRYLTSAELSGIRAVDVYLLRLMKTRKTRPPFVKDVAGLFEDVDLLLDEHEDDDQVLAVDGRPVLLWPDEHSALDDDERFEDGSPVVSVREKNWSDPRKSSTGDDDKENDGLPESALKNSKAAFLSQLARKGPEKKVQHRTPIIVLEKLKEKHFECSPKTRQLTIPEMITSGAKGRRHEDDQLKNSTSISTTLPPPDETIYDFSDETDEVGNRGRNRSFFQFKKRFASTPRSSNPSTAAAFDALGAQREAGETSSTTARLVAFHSVSETSQKSSSSQRAEEASTAGPKSNDEKASNGKKMFLSTVSKESSGSAQRLFKRRCCKCVNCLKLRNCGSCKGCLLLRGSTTLKVRVDWTVRRPISMLDLSGL
jgi:hypothetical protein